MSKTFSLKQSEVQKNWVLIDAKDLVVGRLAVVIANLLRGKNKPTYTPHMNCGDYVIVINAKHLVFTGNKAIDRDGKLYYWHTGHPGGIKEVSAKKVFAGQHPERILIKAVERMITRNSLSRKQMSNLYVYPEATHKHEAQNPTLLDVAALNRKNTKKKVA